MVNEVRFMKLPAAIPTNVYSQSQMKKMSAKHAINWVGTFLM